MASLRLTAAPAVLLSLAPDHCTYPCAHTARGGGSSAASSIAGQITQWKSVMPLPMTCRSAGHRRSNPASGNPVAERELISAANHTYTVCCGSPGKGMPQGWRCVEHPTLELIPTRERNHFFPFGAHRDAQEG